MLRVWSRVFLLLFISVPLISSDLKKLSEEAQKLVEKGLYNEAEVVYEDLLKGKLRTKTRLDILIELSDIEFNRLDKTEEALGHLIEAKALYPSGYRGMDRVYYRLGLVYERLGRFVDAAQSYEQIATSFRDSEYYDDALEGVERVFKKNFPEYLAIVGGEPITRLEFDERLEGIPPFYRSRFETEEGKKELLEMMIDEILMVKEAEARKLYLNSEVQKELMRQRARTLQRALYEEEVKKKSEVKDDELKRYYIEHKENFKIPRKVTVRRIVVKDKSGAESILAELRKGADFDSLAKEKSIAKDASRGGLMENLTDKSRPKEIVEKAFRMKPGKLSDIIQLEDSTFAIIKVEKKEKERYKEFDKVKDQIRNNLQQEKEKALFENLKKTLREEYGVKYAEEIKEETETKLQKIKKE